MTDLKIWPVKEWWCQSFQSTSLFLLLLGDERGGEWWASPRRHWCVTNVSIRENAANSSTAHFLSGADEPLFKYSDSCNELRVALILFSCAETLRRIITRLLWLNPSWLQPQIIFNSPPALLRLTPACVNPIKFPRIVAYWSLLLRRRWRRGGGGVWNWRGPVDIQLSFRLHFHLWLYCFVSYARKSTENRDSKPRENSRNKYLFFVMHVSNNYRICRNTKQIHQQHSWKQPIVTPSFLCLLTVKTGCFYLTFPRRNEQDHRFCLCSWC